MAKRYQEFARGGSGITPMGDEIADPIKHLNAIVVTVNYLNVA